MVWYTHGKSLSQLIIKSLNCEFVKTYIIAMLLGGVTGDSCYGENVWNVFD